MDATTIEAFETSARFAGELMNRLVQQRDTFREETITDIMLLWLREANLRDVAIYKATGKDEGLFGFDWEWWIGSAADGWFRYAVQAKKLGRDGRYRSLRHAVGTPPTTQIKLLRDYAHAQQAIALYAFYNHRMAATKSQAYWQCGLPFDEAQLGCTVVPLFVVEQVHDAKRKAKSFENLHANKFARPLRCLVRCPLLHPLYRSNPLDEAVALGRPIWRGLEGNWATEGVRPPRNPAEPADFNFPHHSLPHYLRSASTRVYSADSAAVAGAYPRSVVVVDLAHDDVRR